jgi:hypothetical protein
VTVFRNVFGIVQVDEVVSTYLPERASNGSRKEKADKDRPQLLRCGLFYRRFFCRRFPNPSARLAHAVFHPLALRLRIERIARFAILQTALDLVKRFVGGINTRDQAADALRAALGNTALPCRGRGHPAEDS